MLSTAYKSLDVTNVFCWLASDIHSSDIIFFKIKTPNC